jgi:predicted nuclease of predicted toxin-antitoxin system
VQFKIDENLPPESAALLRNNGHDALTVWAQRLQGHSDTQIISVCQDEQRTLVTLDLDFADIRAYPPDHYAGIIVMRLSSQSRSHVLRILQNLLPVLRKNRSEVGSGLWMMPQCGFTAKEKNYCKERTEVSP